MNELICKDFTKNNGEVIKGCGQTLRWPTDAEKVDGKKRPLNLDGSDHKHQRSETPEAKPIGEVIEDTSKRVLVANGAWIRELAQEETGKILAKHGLGLGAQLPDEEWVRKIVRDEMAKVGIK